ncbi:polysaccharide deacetylase family protein [Salinisphaera sp.]|uniref:polysaccharide deacetylase family protein n=1 Tax=Salinisphaera sp. TaxID=1914330 RepID=UPI002D768D9E|nr:polysaccharide deacetylase family protein [Salinisphaera sp.]HET7313108.1 polysaccharide deacetylase family protein [Salinisphaera sp.]
MSRKPTQPAIYFGHGVADPMSAPEISSDRLTHVHPDDLDSFVRRYGRYAVLTFDDGYADNLLAALPILERYEQRATVFVTTGFVARRHALLARVAAAVARRLDWERASMRDLIDSSGLDAPGVYAALRDRLKTMTVADRLAAQQALMRDYDLSTAQLTADYLDRAQLDRLAAHELITIGAHTASHPDLRYCTDTELVDELVDARRELESWLGRAVDTLAYPFGDTDARVRRAAARAGYRRAYVTETPNWRSRIPFYRRLDMPRIDLSGEVRRMRRRDRKHTRQASG